VFFVKTISIFVMFIVLYMLMLYMYISPLHFSCAKCEGTRLVLYGTIKLHIYVANIIHGPEQASLMSIDTFRPNYLCVLNN